MAKKKKSTQQSSKKVDGQRINKSWLTPSRPITPTPEGSVPPYTPTQPAPKPADTPSQTEPKPTDTPTKPQPREKNSNILGRQALGTSHSLRTCLLTCNSLP